jgi:hypothetical protein
MPKDKKCDANQDSMLKQKSQPKRAQKCALGNTPHFCLGPTYKEQPSKKKMKLVVGVESNSSYEDSEDSSKTYKFQPKVLRKVLEKMKEINTTRTMGKGVKTHGSGRSSTSGL